MGERKSVSAAFAAVCATLLAFGGSARAAMPEDAYAIIDLLETALNNCDVGALSELIMEGWDWFDAGRPFDESGEAAHLAWACAPGARVDYEMLVDKVKVREDWALVTGRMGGAIVDNQGRARPVAKRWTIILSREIEGWLIDHMHFSPQPR